MESQKRIICRLCFKIQDDIHNSKAVDDLKDVLYKVLRLDFAAIQNSVMCTSCADALMECLDFKEKCTNTHNYIASFIDKDTVKLDLIDVYRTKNENGVGVPEVQDVCGLCISPLKTCSALPVDIEGDVALRQMIERCVPEVDVDIIEKPVICLPCHGSLENCFHFVRNCLIAEEKFKKFCECQDVDSNVGMDLSRLWQFAIRDGAGSVGGSLTDLIKVENQFCEEIKNADEAGFNNGDDVFKFEQVFCDDAKEEFELESEHFLDTDEPKFNTEEQFTLKDTLACKYFVKIEEPFCRENGLKEEDPVEMEDQKCLLNREVEIKREDSDFNRIGVNLQMHRNTSEVTMYKCDLCLFETKYKNTLEDHLQKHKDPSVVTMYKCDSCSFQTKYKDNLKRHVLMHKDPSEVTMYQCNSCSYQTKNNEHLKRHLLKHKDPSEITMYKCHFCPYQEKNKEYLRRHLLKHKDPSEVTVYKCDSCLYQTKTKECFKRHLLKHKDSSEVTMYKCDSCFFETRYKKYLNKHLLTHKDPSDVTMYRCDSCSFQSKYKKSLTRHLLNHKVSLKEKCLNQIKN